MDPVVTTPVDTEPVVTTPVDTEPVVTTPVDNNLITDERRIRELEKHIECLKNQVKAANNYIIHIEQQLNRENSPKCKLPHITYGGKVRVSMNEKLVDMINDALTTACPSFAINDYVIVVPRNMIPVVVCRLQSQSTVYTIDLRGNVINEACGDPDRPYPLEYYAPESCEDDTEIDSVNLQANWDDFTNCINELTNYSD